MAEDRPVCGMEVGLVGSQFSTTVLAWDSHNLIAKGRKRFAQSSSTLCVLLWELCNSLRRVFCDSSLFLLLILLTTRICLPIVCDAN
jgi:hypothetical protein